MEHEILVTKKVSTDDLVNILSSAIYWCNTLDYKEDEYNTSKKNLNSERPCFEDVLVQMLQDGYYITWLDSESRSSYNMNMASLLKGIQQHIELDKASLDIDDWDANDANCVVQYALFNEIIYN